MACQKGESRIPLQRDRDQIRVNNDFAPPAFPLAKAHKIAAELFGISGTLGPLPSERDQIFLLSSETGRRFVLRISGRGEPQAILEFQNQALFKIAAEDPTLPVPRVCASIARRTVELIQEGTNSYGVRLLSFVPGVPIRDQPCSRELFRDIGRSLARLDRALNGLRHPDKDYFLLWNVKGATDLRPLLIHIIDRDQRRLAEIVFDDLDTHVLAKLARLRSQVIHNDFNPKNVLVDPAVPTHVSGIIDFGDLVSSALVVDLGVAVARHIGLTDTLSAAVEIVAGYHSVLALTEDEIAILYFVICARLAMRATIWSWRMSVRDPRCDPSQIENALDLLALLADLGPRKVTDVFRAARQMAGRRGGETP